MPRRYGSAPALMLAPTPHIDWNCVGHMFVPGECQGQTVEVSYGWTTDGEGWILRRTFDRSDGETSWSIADGSDVPESWHPTNSPPPVAATAWQPVVVDEE